MNNLIHSNGRQFVYKPVVPIIHMDNALHFCGGGCSEMYQCKDCQKRFGKPSMMWTATTCAECEKKRKEKECQQQWSNGQPINTSSEQVKSSEPSNPTSSMETTASFEFGDLVELLPYGEHDQYAGTIGKITLLTTPRNGGEKGVVIEGCDMCWPLRAIRHAFKIGDEVEVLDSPLITKHGFRDDIGVRGKIGKFHAFHTTLNNTVPGAFIDKCAATVPLSALKHVTVISEPTAQFKIGDVVTILDVPEIHKSGVPEEIGKSGVIVSFVNFMCGGEILKGACLKDFRCSAPLISLCHAETEPQFKDGWILNPYPKNLWSHKTTTMWVARTASGKWECDLFNPVFDTWLQLKSEIEKYQKGIK